MIPRKLAKRLLAEYRAAVEATGGLAGTAGLAPDDLLAVVADAILAESDLVLRGTENVEQKARRYLAEGRIVVERVDPTGLVIARARGSAGDEYALGYDPGRRQWRCTCPVKGPRCSHLAALRLVVPPR